MIIYIKDRFIPILPITDEISLILSFKGFLFLTPLKCKLCDSFILFFPT